MVKKRGVLEGKFYSRRREASDISGWRAYPYPSTKHTSCAGYGCRQQSVAMSATWPIEPEAIVESAMNDTVVVGIFKSAIGGYGTAIITYGEKCRGRDGIRAKRSQNKMVIPPGLNRKLEPPSTTATGTSVQSPTNDTDNRKIRFPTLFLNCFSPAFCIAV